MAIVGLGIFNLGVDMRWKLLGSAILAIGASVAASGCIAAAAGAGAATGIYLTSRGAESLVEGSVEEVAARTQAAFREFDITHTREVTERGGDIRNFEGTTGESTVTVNLERKSPTTTNVEVTVRKNEVEWDKEHAQEILASIVGE